MGDEHPDLVGPDVVAEFFRACGIPGDAVPELVASCDPGTSWRHWLVVADEWLWRHRGLVNGPNNLPVEPASVDTPEELLALCQRWRVSLLDCSDDEFGRFLARAVAAHILEAMRRMGAVDMPDVPGRPASVAEAQRGLDRIIGWCHAKIGKPDGPPDGPRHAPDFRSVNWFGTAYTFTPTQAACVRTLWEAWQNGTPEVGEQTVLEAIDSDSDRLTDIFGRGKGRHPAWGTMIRPGATKGTIRLAEPEQKT